jgi:hypothetical protein
MPLLSRTRHSRWRATCIERCPRGSEGGCTERTGLISDEPGTSRAAHPVRSDPGQARSTALFQLATEIPAAILARTLGVHTDVAVAWQRHSVGDWVAYAADVSQRGKP